jgi:tRNA (Thr-GGU) A37 N-methylase
MSTTKEGTIVNKIKQSDKLVTLDLQKFFDETPIAELDIKQFLYKDLILKEKSFREALEEHNWQQYKDAYVAVFCSSDAIISKWAYMLVTQHAINFSEDVFKGSKPQVINQLYIQNLEGVDWEQYQDKFVILKEDCIIKENFKDALADLGHNFSEIEIISQLDSTEAIKTLVRKGYGVAFVPYNAVRDEFSAKEINVSRIKNYDFDYDIYMINKKAEFLSDDVREFISNFKKLGKHICY